MNTTFIDILRIENKLVTDEMEDEGDNRVALDYFRASIHFVAPQLLRFNVELRALGVSVRLFLLSSFPLSNAIN